MSHVYLICHMSSLIVFVVVLVFALFLLEFSDSKINIIDILVHICEIALFTEFIFVIY